MGFEIVEGLAQEGRVLSAGVSRVNDGDVVRLQVEAGGGRIALLDIGPVS